MIVQKSMEEVIKEATHINELPENFIQDWNLLMRFAKDVCLRHTDEQQVMEGAVPYFLTHDPEQAFFYFYKKFCELRYYKPHSFGVKLHDTGNGMLRCIRIIKDVTKLGLIECRDLAKSSPTIVCKELSAKHAMKVVQAFREIGAQAEVVPEELEDWF